MSNNRFKGDPHHVLRERLMYIIKDSAKCTRWINEFFEQCPDVPSFALRFTNKKLDNRLRDGLFDGEDFIKRLRNTIQDGFIDDPDGYDPFDDVDDLETDDFQEWLQSQDNDAFNPETYMDDGIRKSVEDLLHGEHKRNRKKLIKKQHPMERLSDGSDDDRVGIFSISYVEYLEKQNDALRRKMKEDKDAKKK